jgi:hypothetical protein
MQNGFPLEIIIRPAAMPMLMHAKKEGHEDEPEDKKKKAKAARALSKLFAKKEGKD